MARESAPNEPPLRVKVVRAGPDRAVVDKVARRVLAHPSVRKQVKRGRHRLLSVELVEPEETTKRARQVEPTRHRATIYDYAQNRALVVEGALDGRGGLEVTESGHQPQPTSDEFAAALQLLGKTRSSARRSRQEGCVPIRRCRRCSTRRTTPDVPSGRSPSACSRTARGVEHEIVGVNLVRRTVVRLDGGAPATALAAAATCGVRQAGQRTTGGVHVPGEAIVTVTQGGKTLWRFRVVRPAATKGPHRSTNGTGVELRYVDYRGKRVLYRAHAPILNVKYDGDRCGPYRDWQNEEGMIHATGTDVAPGFRLCPAPATTILETGSDKGNFLGVGIYVEGDSVVLVSEMEAGWYRYISKWRLYADGTIKPRFGFSAVESSCVCNVHRHHVYWRLDFDIRTPGNNRYASSTIRRCRRSSEEMARPSLRGPRARAPAHKRRWRVENTATREAYDIVPGPDDGVARAFPDWPFGRGDLWLVRCHRHEIDDGVARRDHRTRRTWRSSSTASDRRRRRRRLVRRALHARHRRRAARPFRAHRRPDLEARELDLGLSGARAGSPSSAPSGARGGGSASSRPRWKNCHQMKNAVESDETTTTPRR